MCGCVGFFLGGGGGGGERFADLFPPNEPYGFCGRKATLNHA